MSLDLISAQVEVYETIQYIRKRNTNLILFHTIQYIHTNENNIILHSRSKASNIIMLFPRTT